MYINREMTMPKKKKEEEEELYPDEDTTKILKTSNFIKTKEEPDYKAQIKEKLNGAINLLQRNVRNKQRALDKIREAIELLKKI